MCHKSISTYRNLNQAHQQIVHFFGSGLGCDLETTQHYDFSSGPKQKTSNEASIRMLTLQMHSISFPLSACWTCSLAILALSKRACTWSAPTITEIMRALVSVLHFKRRWHSILGIVVLRCLAQLCARMLPLSLKQMVTAWFPSNGYMAIPGLFKASLDQSSPLLAWPMEVVIATWCSWSVGRPVAKWWNGESKISQFEQIWTMVSGRNQAIFILSRLQTHHHHHHHHFIFDNDKSKPTLYVQKLPFSSSARVESNFVASCQRFARKALPHGPTVLHHLHDPWKEVVHNRDLTSTMLPTQHLQKTHHQHPPWSPVGVAWLPPFGQHDASPDGTSPSIMVLPNDHIIPTSINALFQSTLILDVVSNCLRNQWCVILCIYIMM